MRMYLSSSGQKGDPNTLNTLRTFHLYNEHKNKTRVQEALLKFKVNAEQKVTDVALCSKTIKKIVTL